MDMATRDGLWALTEKEKQTLRLIVRGPDAKSSARCLGLSVHTINERLRDARRKMAVSSSREAARMLLDAEGGSIGAPPPDLSADTRIGEDAATPSIDQASAPAIGVGPAHRRPRIIIGGLCMTLFLGAIALVAVPQLPTAPLPATSQEAPAPDSAMVEAARQWLALVDQGRWADSYKATGAAFRKLNTAEVWAATSEQVRVPLGAVLSRTFASQQNLPAPPAGYEVVKFRTSFANKAAAVETVTLEREAGGWHVVSVTIE